MDRALSPGAAVSGALSFPTPTVLQAATPTETAYGGETLAWTTVATIWIALKPGAASYDQLEQQQPVRIETASATARDDPRAASGQQLLVGDDANPWRVRAVEHANPQPGVMTLRLDRTA
jgi:hypothetical protein